MCAHRTPCLCTSLALVRQLLHEWLKLSGQDGPVDKNVASQPYSWPTGLTSAAPNSLGSPHPLEMDSTARGSYEYSGSMIKAAVLRGNMGVMWAVLRAGVEC